MPRARACGNQQGATEEALGGSMHTPQQTVSAFIVAYQAWNDQANECDRPSCGSSTMDQQALADANAEYDQLMARFCVPSVVRAGYRSATSRCTIRTVKRSSRYLYPAARHRFAPNILGGTTSCPNTNIDYCWWPGSGGLLLYSTLTRTAGTSACKCSAEQFAPADRLRDLSCFSYGAFPAMECGPSTTSVE